MLAPAHHLRLTLAFLQLKGVGPVAARALSARVSDIPLDPSVVAVILNNLGRKPRGFAGVSALELARCLDAADRTIETCAAQRITIAFERASPFWAPLWAIPSPPAALFFKGDPAAARQPGIAIVGTREPTGWGRESSARIARRCCERGFAVVSGLAEGCDTSAHEGALDAGGRTIAVLAHGLDTVSPVVNRRLADRILKSGGMLVSEYPPGVTLRPHRLVERNRLQAGLSRAVIVVETDVKGGTMHTVAFASAQRRKLAALSHPQALLHERQAMGNQELIRSGRAFAVIDDEALNPFLDGLAAVCDQAADPSAHVPESLFEPGTGA